MKNLGQNLEMGVPTECCRRRLRVRTRQRHRDRDTHSKSWKIKKSRKSISPIETIATYFLEVSMGQFFPVHNLVSKSLEKAISNHKETWVAVGKSQKAFAVEMDSRYHFIQLKLRPGFYTRSWLCIILLFYFLCCGPISLYKLLSRWCSVVQRFGCYTRVIKRFRLILLMTHV